MARFSTLAIFIAVLALTANAAPAEPAPVAAPPAPAAPAPAPPVAAPPVAAPPAAAPAKVLSPECVALKETAKEARKAAKASLGAIPTPDLLVKFAVDEAHRNLADVKVLHHGIHVAVKAAKGAAPTDKETARKAMKKEIHENATEIRAKKAEIKTILTALKASSDKSVAEKAAASIEMFHAARDAKKAFKAKCGGHHHHHHHHKEAPAAAAAPAAPPAVAA